MFIVLLTYHVPLEQVDDAIPAHVDWLEENYSAGLFLASGRQVPRTGGVILATGSRERVEAAIENDPFGQRGVASHQIIEFLPSKFGGVLEEEAIREALS